MKVNLTPEIVRKLLSYDPKTGRLFWKKRFADQKLGITERYAKTFNSQFAGKEAFTADHGNGYKLGRIFDRGYLAHRVVWCIFHGKWPKGPIDHINGDRSDNRINNLRNATATINARNIGISGRNTSGVIGVSFNKHAGKFSASIKANGRNVFLGYYTELEEAKEVRKQAEIKYGYHENHGNRLSFRKGCD